MNLRKLTIIVAGFTLSIFTLTSLLVATPDGLASAASVKGSGTVTCKFASGQITFTDPIGGSLNSGGTGDIVLKLSSCTGGSPGQSKIRAKGQVSINDPCSSFSPASYMMHLKAKFPSDGIAASTLSSEGLATAFEPNGWQVDAGGFIKGSYAGDAYLLMSWYSPSDVCSTGTTYIDVGNPFGSVSW